MKKSKKRAKKYKPSCRVRKVATFQKLVDFYYNIKPELREQFLNEQDQLIEDFTEGNISLRQLEEKANDLIKKYPQRHSKFQKSKKDTYRRKGL